MTEILDKALQIGRNSGLILNDEDLGGEFALDLFLGVLFKHALLFFGNSENVGCFRGGEAFQGCQQESLALDRGKGLKPLVGRIACGTILSFKLGASRTPDHVEEAIERQPRIFQIINDFRVFDERLE